MYVGATKTYFGATKISLTRAYIRVRAMAEQIVTAGLGNHFNLYG